MDTQYQKDVLDDAIALALTHHNGQVNKHNGEAYVCHVHRVANLARDRGLSLSMQATAWLHDTLEDTELTFPDLMIVMPNSIAMAVEILTKKKGESNETYYLRVRENPMARQVKLCDMTDNFRRNHLITDPDTRERMMKKYSLGFDILS